MNFNKNKFIKKEIDLIISPRNRSILLKRLRFSIKKSLGRDKNGQLTYQKGGGVKKLYTLLNSNHGYQDHRILQTLYDAYRSTFINLIQYRTGELSYSPASIHDQKYRALKGESKKYLLDGARYRLTDIPNKTLISNIQIKEHQKPSIGLSAGSNCKLFTKSETSAVIVLPSKKKIEVPTTSWATIGIPSNSYRKLNKNFKAGTNRYLNRRPVVRGVAMNPVDHPHGGGEGKATSGRPCVSPWGKLTKNVPTRRKYV